MFCKKCGNKLKENTKFCSKCGNKITLKKETKNKKTNKIYILIIILLIITVTLSILIKNRIDLNKPLNEEWGNKYYLYLKEIKKSKNVKKAGLNENIKKAKISFYQVKNIDNPVMVIKYSQNKKDYSNVYYIKNNKINVLVYKEPTIVEFLYNIEDKKYDYYSYTTDKKSKTIQKLENEITKKEESFVYENEEDFKKEFIKPDIKSKDLDYNINLKDKDLKKLVIKGIDNYQTQDEIVTDKVKSEVEDKLEKIELEQEKEENVYLDYLKNEQYYLDIDEVVNEPSEYLITDINGDGIKELLIVAYDDRFSQTLLFTYNPDTKQIILVEDLYGYGTLKYNKQTKEIAYSETSMTSTTWGYVFYKLKNNKLETTGGMYQDVDNYYIKNNTSDYQQTSESEFKKLLKSFGSFDYKKLSDLRR